MKKILFAAGIVLTGLSAAFAQNLKQNQNTPAATGQSRAADNAGMKQADPETAAQRRTARLSKELSLTSDQQQKVHDIFLKESQNTNGRAALRQETDDRLKAIFTAEQNQKYEAIKAERKQAMMERRAAGRSDLQAAPGTVK